MSHIDLIRISSPQRPVVDGAAGNSFLGGCEKPARRKPSRPIRHGLGLKVAEYAIANPDKTVRQVADHFETSTAYVRKTEERMEFSCARVNRSKA